jgi:hypothetical protein
MLISVSWGPEADAEIALVASSAAERTYEENSVKDTFKEPSSSGLEDSVAATVRTKGRPAQDRHGLHLTFLAGSNIVHPKRPWKKVGMWHCRNVAWHGELRETAA